MLAHEAAHLALGDPLWFALADLLCAVLWWHPLVWWARRSFHQVCEAAADEASALLPTGPIALAESLLAFGRELSLDGPRTGFGIGGSGSKSELGLRVEALLKTRIEWRKLSAWWLWAPRMLAVCIVSFLILSPLQSVHSGSIGQALANCLQERPDGATPAGVNHLPSNQGQVKEQAPPAADTNQNTSAVLSVEFGEVPDSNSLETLFPEANKPELTSLGSLPDDVFQGATLPTQKQVRTDRSITENQCTLITRAQFEELRQRIFEQAGVEWLYLTNQGVEVKSGQEALAQVSVSQLNTILFDVETADGTATNHSASVNYQAGEVFTGPEARIRPRATQDGWQLDIAVRVLEFLGYDDPGSFAPQARAWSAPGVPKPEPIKAKQPLPHFRLRESRASVAARTGQTAVIRGPLKTDIKLIKSGLLGRTREQKTATRLYVFISLLPKTETDKKSR